MRSVAHWCRCFTWFVGFILHFHEWERAIVVVQLSWLWHSACMWHAAVFEITQTSERMQVGISLPYTILFCMRFEHRKAEKLLLFHNFIFGFVPCGMAWVVNRASQPKRYDEREADALLCLWYFRVVSDFMSELQSRTFRTWKKGFSILKWSTNSQTRTHHIKCHIKNYKTVKNCIRLFCHPCHNPFRFGVRIYKLDSFAIRLVFFLFVLASCLSFIIIVCESKRSFRSATYLDNIVGDSCVHA